MTKSVGRERYLLVAPQGLGDCLEATPLLEALKTYDPDAAIDVVVLRHVGRMLFEGLRDYVDEVILLPYWDAGAPAFVRALISQRRGRKYDAAFLAYPSARPVYEVLLSMFHAKRRYAHRHAPRMLLDFPPLHATLVPVRAAHNVERNRDLLRAAGIPADTRDTYIVPKDWIADEPRDENRIAVHIGTASHDGMAERRWPPDRFTELCRRLVAEGRAVTIIVGPDERVESEALRRDVPGVEKFEGSLPEVARFLSTCGMLIANDSGIAHLAAGVGARVVALFGPTPVEHAPYSPRAIALRPSTCPPCFDVRRPVAECILNIDFACLKADLTVDVVMRAAGLATSGRALD
jgi:ADP-heptose:LPS heptosyltransferase